MSYHENRGNEEERKEYCNEFGCTCPSVDTVSCGDSIIDDCGNDVCSSGTVNILTSNDGGMTFFECIDY